MKGIFWYCLGYAAQAHGLEVHAATLMSSHHHVVVTDVQGLLPRFLQDFHRTLALATKALRGWPEEVFNKESTSCYELVTPEAQLHGIAYAMANPVDAFAVRYAQQWPGAIVSPQDPERRVIRAERPPYFFDPNNPAWPDVVELPIRLPAGLEESNDQAQARKSIAERTRQYERDAWQRAKAQGISFAGVKKVMRRRHTDRASSYEQFGTRAPRFSAAGNAKAAAEAVRRLRQFNQDYDAALVRWQRGKRRVTFPHGTWWMRVHHKVRCRAPP